MISRIIGKVDRHVVNTGQKFSDYRTELVKKAQAAKNAAAVGLIPQEQADALWAQAVEACKPSPEAIALAKAAKAKKDDAEKVLKAAYKRKVQECKVQSDLFSPLCTLHFALCTLNFEL